MIRSHTRIIVQQRRPRFSRLSYCPLLARTLALDLRITHARTLTLSAWHASWVWCAEPPWLPALIPTSARRIPTETRNARGTKTNASENRIARNCPSRLLARRGLAPSGMLAPRPAPTRAYSLMLAVDTRSRTLTVTSAPGSVCGCLLVALSPPLCASLVSRPTTTSTLWSMLSRPCCLVLRLDPTSTVQRASAQPTSTLGYVLHNATFYVPSCIDADPSLSCVCVTDLQARSKPKSCPPHRVHLPRRAAAPQARDSPSRMPTIRSCPRQRRSE